MTVNAPSIATIAALRDDLRKDIVRTPLLRCTGLERLLNDGTKVWGKLETLQRTGTFKARGALSVLRSLTDEQLRAGVTAVSAGNHAIATAFAASVAGTSAKVVMLSSASPCRIEACRSFGAEVVLADDVHEAFDVAERIREEEGRFFVHPYDSPEVVAGTGTIGLEICEQCERFDTVLVSIGGGGLMAGISNAIKQLRPDVETIGVEPMGADSMWRSFAVGEPRGIERVATIADSLGAPYALPYTFGLCRQNVDRLVRVDEQSIREAMGILFSSTKLAVEPACAATTAALMGLLRNDLEGREVVLVFCGSNIDWPTFEEQAIF